MTESEWQCSPRTGDSSPLAKATTSFRFGCIKWLRERDAEIKGLCQLLYERDSEQMILDRKLADKLEIIEKLKSKLDERVMGALEYRRLRSEMVDHIDSLRECQRDVEILKEQLLTEKENAAAKEECSRGLELSLHDMKMESDYWKTSFEQTKKDFESLKTELAALAEDLHHTKQALLEEKARSSTEKRDLERTIEQLKEDLDLQKERLRSERHEWELQAVDEGNEFINLSAKYSQMERKVGEQKLINAQLKAQIEEKEAEAIAAAKEYEDKIASLRVSLAELVQQRNAEAIEMMEKVKAAEQRELQTKAAFSELDGLCSSYRERFQLLIELIENMAEVRLEKEQPKKRFQEIISGSAERSSTRAYVVEELKSRKSGVSQFPPSLPLLHCEEEETLMVSRTVEGKEHIMSTPTDPCKHSSADNAGSSSSSIDSPRFQELIRRNATVLPHLRAAYPEVYQRYDVDENALRSGTLAKLPRQHGNKKSGHSSIVKSLFKKRVGGCGEGSVNQSGSSVPDENTKPLD